jgi:apolipoprotein N-acyltransferase
MQMLTRFDFSKIIGWRRNLLSFLLGVCATFTLAPFYIFPLIIPAYAGLFLLTCSAATRKRAFADGWWWGWGFYISGLYWFCIALLTDAEKFAWAIPFTLFGLNAVIALYPALACLLFYILFPRRESACGSVARVCGFSFIWLAVEYARGHLFSGFPWNLAGYSFGFSEASLQLASVVGAYGLTLFTILLGTSVAVIRCGRTYVFGIWALFAASLLWGSYRLSNAGEGEATGVVLRLVQANILQPHKWDPRLQMQNLQDYIHLTQSAGLEKVTHVIWPETATPYVLRSSTPLAYHLGESIPAGVMLITGALRTEGEGKEMKFYNSVLVINNYGKIIANYDKRALVPFGEFMPMRYLIPKFVTLPVGDSDFSIGAGAQELDIPGLPVVGVLICYEGIFPGLVAEAVSSGAVRPQWLLNVTNDAWFGMSSGPHQHFQMARMRAVEQGLPLVRVANTGITAYIDEYGRIKQQLPLGVRGMLDVPLQKSTLSNTTYSLYNKLFMLLFVCAGAILSIIFKKIN